MPSYPRVEEYMSTPVVVVKPSDTLAHVRNLMLRYRVGRIVVVDDALRPIGVVAKSDFVKLFSNEAAAKRSLESVLVEEVMTTNPVTIESGRSIREAARLMLHHNISGLPVVDSDGRLVGIITKTDIVRAYAERLRGKYRVSDYMYENPPTVSPQHSIAYVAELLESHPSRRVLVVEGDRLVGIIAPSDLAFLEAGSLGAATRGRKRIRRFAELPKGRLGPVYLYAIPVAQDVMTPDPVTVRPEDDLATAAQHMLRGGFSSVPVVDSEERVVGILVKHNILKAVAEK